MLKLSHSSLETYNQCGKKYYLHYIEKYRSPYFDSPLFFGKIVDDAIARVLLDKKPEHSEAEKEVYKKSYKDIVLERVSAVEINKEIVDPTSTNLIRYFKSDFDISVFLPEDYFLLEELSAKLGLSVDKKTAVAFHKEAFDLLKIQELTSAENELYNFLLLTSLKRKALLFCEAFIKNILPTINEVHSLQREISLPGEGEDKITGFIDFEATFNDGVRRIVDIKTSSKKYDLDSVRKKQQLSIYSEEIGNPNCGYIVFIKPLRIKDPRVDIQVIFDTITEEDKTPIFENIEKTYFKIKENVFEKNEDSCYAYGRKCQFYDLCHNNDVSNLIKK